jgi:cellulose synthase/poly-beta-1,6-N-acetylglucosamine synthase-like glycosyltransferase
MADPQHMQAGGPACATTVTVLIPAYNEAQTIGATLRSLQAQTRLPDEILVVDDGSGDDTGIVAAGLGAQVMRTVANTGFKAGAMNAGLPHVWTEWLVTLDADTILAPTALDEIVAAAEEHGAVAACGQVLPQRIHTLWERARLIEYLFAFGVLKPVQDWYRHPMVASGCFALYHTATLRAMGGFPTDTVGEDLDLTWRLYLANKTVKYVGSAVCYPVEPPNYRLMRRQLRRWSHGFVQNLMLHGRRLLGVPMLRSFVAVASLDALLAGLLYGLLMPLVILAYGPRFLLTLYVADMLFMLGPVVWAGYRCGLLRQALASLPFVFVLRLLNTYYFWRAVIVECVFRRPLTVFEKGH